jgi:tetratricopeptide (TPR) repeat protein
VALGVGAAVVTGVAGFLLAGGAEWLGPSAERSGAIALEPTPEEAESVASAVTQPSAAAPDPDALVDHTSPHDPAFDWNEEGFRLLNEGDFEGAIGRFQAAADLWPETAVYSNNLAEALFRSAKELWDEEPVEALARLERALEVLQDEERRKELTPLRDRWRKARDAEDGFWTQSSPYFAVSFDGTRRELMNQVDDVLADLDTFYAEFGDLFGRRPVEEGRARIRVVFYRRKTFDEVTGLGDWAGGVFDGTIRVPVGSLDEERDRLRTVLRHELMHAFVQHIGGGKAPAWLNEGLAQWIERPGEGRALDLALARGRIRNHELFELTDLRGSLAAWTDKDAITRAYAQALLLVDHVAYSKGESLLFDMVAASGQKGVTGPEQLFLERFPGFPLQEFAATVPR